jgi:hypothetical protein
MITAEEKQEIIEVIGKHYSIAIIQHLENEGIKPVKADCFTPNLMQQIVNGTHENEAVEMEILRFLNKKRILKEKILKKRQSLIKK